MVGLMLFLGVILDPSQRAQVLYHQNIQAVAHIDLRSALCSILNPQIHHGYAPIALPITSTHMVDVVPRWEAAATLSRYQLLL